MKKKKVLFSILGIILALLILLFIFILFLPHFEIKNATGLIGEAYTPEVKIYNILKDISDKAEIKNNVDINKVGKYNVECKIKYLFIDIKQTFEVHIVDKEKPLISLLGSDTAVVCPLKEYIEEGYSAVDNYDGDISDKVNVEKVNNSIIYSVLDSSNNSAKIERNIIYEDKDNPIITLNGNSIVSVYLGNSYIEPGYSAYDNCDGDITSNVVTSGYVDTSKIGTYTIKYEVTDSNNNTISTERIVVVKKKISSYGNGKIYLTFDDGSSYLTSQILDILKEKNVKATFFVVNVNETTKRAYNEGHAIALHSNTHNYSYIYANSNNYFQDLENISNKVYNLIGIKPKIIRFPGGSSNTISRNYNKGIMTYLTSEVLNRGYVYFDWNIDSNDAGSDIRNSNNIYYNVVNNLSHSKTNIVLMHDSGGHDATVSALKEIIEYGKTYGYTFDVITENTPVVAHSVNN